MVRYHNLAWQKVNSKKSRGQWDLPRHNKGGIKKNYQQQMIRLRKLTRDYKAKFNVRKTGKAPIHTSTPLKPLETSNRIATPIGVQNGSQKRRCHLSQDSGVNRMHEEFNESSINLTNYSSQSSVEILDFKGDTLKISSTCSWQMYKDYTPKVQQSVYKKNTMSSIKKKNKSIKREMNSGVMNTHFQPNPFSTTSTPIERKPKVCTFITSVKKKMNLLKNKSFETKPNPITPIRANKKGTDSTPITSVKKKPIIAKVKKEPDSLLSIEFNKKKAELATPFKKSFKLKREPGEKSKSSDINKMQPWKNDDLKLQITKNAPRYRNDQYDNYKYKPKNKYSYKNKINKYYNNCKNYYNKKWNDRYDYDSYKNYNKKYKNDCVNDYDYYYYGDRHNNLRRPRSTSDTTDISHKCRSGNKNDLKMEIVNIADPTGKIFCWNENIVERAVARIFTEEARTKAFNTVPRCEASSWRNGFFNIDCADYRTRDLLIRGVDRIPPLWKERECRLAAIRRGSFATYQRVQLFMNKSLPNYGEFLRSLERQNPELNIWEWRYYDCCRHDSGGVVLIFFIDGDSYKLMKKNNGYVYYGFGKLLFDLYPLNTLDKELYFEMKRNRFDKTPNGLCGEKILLANDKSRQEMISKRFGLLNHLLSIMHMN